MGEKEKSPMVGFKKNQKSQELDITNVGKLKLVERGKSSTKKAGGATPKKGAPKSSAVAPKGQSKKPMVRKENIEARIAQRAYEIYEERCRLGASLQDWLRAEREVLAELDS
ncbi:DUF2934 domain-containing protein [Candidatus Nitronereus thalassa]|uniref:DUF2934 domain-containing protein n=1 Tax=Candidatus Nitronereus thalassa TaxID=3020898 RepID=A0ABU3K5R1_9BACT|nr:DUF2934 domain-containing protein [Candidatus Nitronereus thalassa]MDT7041713.1 DUF2934 domain-containing protein [Candidatus Nitronereus thalassa]